jgi:hypothetical protein
MLKFYCLITGDDLELVRKDTPASIKKIKTLGTIVFIPVILWFISGFLLATQILGKSSLIGFSTAIVMGAIIFILEKSILMMPKSKILLLFRFALGFLIAFMGATITDQVLFKTDIDKQMLLNKQNEIDQTHQEIQNNYQKTLGNQTSLAAKRNEEWIQSLDLARKEADGTAGSGTKGVHSITKLKMSIAAENEKNYKESVKDLELTKSRLVAEKEHVKKEIEESFTQESLLLRIKALHDLIQKNKSMRSIYFGATILLFLLEFSVILLKICGPKTNYEKKLDLIEEIGQLRMQKFNTSGGSTNNSYRSTKTYSSVLNDLHSVTSKRIL